MQTSVIFANEPRFSEHEADQKFNDRKKALIPEIEAFIASHNIFTGKHVTVTFFHTGVSSLVGVLDADGERYVLKIPLSVLDSRLEGRFLKVWESSGVKVPKVIEEGGIGSHHYTLMEYVDAPNLAGKYSPEQMVRDGIYREMGAMLRMMHEPKARGFSNIVNDKSEPEYPGIVSWIRGDKSMQNQIAFVRENNLLNDAEHGSIDEALALIAARIGSDDESVYCHNDFNSNNIFATDPMTVFDPWPCFHHPYMDLSRAIVVSLIGVEHVDEQLLDGYFGDEEYDRQLLQAFVLLNVYVKFKYQFETGNEDGMRNMKEYLSWHKELLDNVYK